jgi:hypothetical protein
MMVDPVHTIAAAGASSADPELARLASQVVAATQGDRTILLDVHGGHYFSLDGVGGEIWAMLHEGMELQEIEKRLAREYDASPEQIARDLRTLVEQLRGEGLIS